MEAVLMGKLPHIASMIYNQPLLITEEKLYEILEAIGARLELEQISKTSMSWPTTSQNSTPSSNGNIAIIPINGTLTHAPMSGVNAQSGLMSYQEIQARFDQAMNNPQIDTILLNINSNGGQVNGCFDLVDHIYNSRGTKPIIAISNESAYSAAYAIGSAADKFYVTRTAGAGSVGVVALHADMSKKLEQDGIKYTAIYAGKHKIDASPHKPLSESAKNTIQTRVNDTYHLFVNTVARNRNLDPEKIYSTEANIYDGQKAVDIGLADKVTTYDNVINQYGGNNNMDLQMELDTTKTELIQLKTKYERLEKDLADLETSVPAMIQEATELGRTTELNRVMAILEKCIAGQKIELAEDLIKNNNTPEQAAALIMQAKALESEHEQVSSAIAGTTATGPNPLVKNAEERAQIYINHPYRK